MDSHIIFEPAVFGDKEFIIKKFDAFTGVGLLLELVKRAAPAIYISESEKPNFDMNALISAVTDMPREELTSILKTCLKNVWSKEQNKPIYNSDFLIGYEWVKFDLALCMAMAIKVIEVNFRGFFTGDFAKYLPR